MKKIKSLLSLIITPFIFLVAIGIILTSCGFQSAKPSIAEITQTFSVYSTAISNEIITQLTFSAGSTAVTQLTQIALPTPINTPGATPTSVMRIIQTPIPTEILPTVVVPEVECNRARLLSESGVQQNATMTAGSAFSKTWRIMNIGACPWTSDYALVFMGGELVPSIITYYPSRAIYPGESFDVTLDVVAPLTPGVYRGEWLLKSDRGILFGLDDQVDNTLTINIRVIKQLTNTVDSVDLTENICRQDWRSGTGIPACLGSVDDPNGSVILLREAYLESHRVNKPAIFTKPNNAPNGWIVGTFREYNVKDSDHFKVEIDCFQDSPGCSLIYKIDARKIDGSITNLGAWQESNDGNSTLIDLNLSLLAGERVHFELTVLNQGDVGNANAVWVAPRIENTSPIVATVLIWHRSDASNCNELTVNLIGEQYSVVEAIDCERGNRVMGSMRLADIDFYQVLDWYKRYKPIEVDLYNNASSAGSRSWLSFRGGGELNASQADFEIMQGLVENLFKILSQ